MMHTGTLSETFTTGQSEGKAPAPFDGPRRTCHREWIDGVAYDVICANCAFDRGGNDNG